MNNKTEEEILKDSEQANLELDISPDKLKKLLNTEVLKINGKLFVSTPKVVSMLEKFHTEQSKQLFEEIDIWKNSYNEKLIKIGELDSELSQQKELVEEKEEINKNWKSRNNALVAEFGKEWEKNKQLESEITSLKQEIEALKKENEEADELCKKILNGKGTIYFSQLNRTIESQSLRIKELEEGISKIAIDKYSCTNSRAIAEALLSSPNTEPKEE